MFGKFDSNIISVMLRESSDPLTPYPPRPHIGEPYGGYQGGLNEGGDIMSLTPKLNMFLEST